MPLSWRQLRRSLAVGQHVAVVSLDVLRADDCTPRFAIRWFRNGKPDVPTRLTGEQMTAVMAFKTKAIAEMTATLAAEPKAPPRPHIGPWLSEKP